MRNKVVPAVLLPLVLVLLALVGCGGAVEATAGNAVGVINGLEPSSKPHTVRITGAINDYTLGKIGEAVRSAGERGVFVSLDLSGMTGLTYIGNETFRDCATLTGVTIPGGVTNIGDEAFSGCIALTNMDIPDGVTQIGISTFSSCISLASVTIPRSVTEIGNSAFRGCIGLTGVTIPNGVTNIGFRAFSDCTGIIGELVIPASVTNIGPGAFRGTNLTSVTFEDKNSVWTLGDGSNTTTMDVVNPVTNADNLRILWVNWSKVQ